jgi:hypothetical protein
MPSSPRRAHRGKHRCFASGLIVASFALAFPATASYHIESLYSDQSGFAQNIELREDSPDGKITTLAGSIITVRRGNVVKRYVLTADPPAGFPAGGTLLVSTIDDLPPDYVMPALFLPTDGGTIDLDGQDPWTFDFLPTDGTTKLLRSGLVAPATVLAFASGGWVMYFEFTNVVEYYAPALGHYFMSGSEPDIDAIESDRIPGWVETGYELGALTVPVPQYCCSTYGQIAVPVCRFYIPPPADSHFFSAFAEECDAVAAKFPSLVLETTTAFYVYLPNAETGECPYPFVPVYRVWNQRADTNHRFVQTLDLRGEMLAQGWAAEGRGPLGVAWCN